VWGREVDGLRLTFHLAGINNQNFLMRDEETGTYWQQISGRAIAGPLAGRALPFVASEELTLAQWKAEQPRGAVLRDQSQYASEYAPKDWDVKMRKAPVVLSYAAPGVRQRDIMLGVEIGGAARAFPYDAVVAGKLVLDHVGPAPVLLVVGPDGESVRVFRAPQGAEFYRIDGARDPLAPLMLDSAGTKWNFQGCAADNPSRCLERVEAIKDYWFDWRHYHPGTTVYRGR
jgi:hypothetical protein